MDNLNIEIDELHIEQTITHPCGKKEVIYVQYIDENDNTSRFQAIMDDYYYHKALLVSIIIVCCIIIVFLLGYIYCPMILSTVI